MAVLSLENFYALSLLKQVLEARIGNRRSGEKKLLICRSFLMC
jgi:hypothetical protein